MVFVERSFPVFVRNVVFCGENVLVLGEKWYSGEQLSYFGEKESCCFVGATSRFGEKMVCGGENITGRKVDGPCILAEMDEGEVLCPENPVGTDLASLRTMQKEAGRFQVQKAFPPQNATSSLGTLTVLPPHATSLPERRHVLPHIPLCSRHTLSPPPRPLVSAKYDISPANLQLSLPNILLAPQK